MTNRGTFHTRFYAGNKVHPDEMIKEKGLLDVDHKYYVVIVESTERPDIPVKKQIRAELMSYSLIEENLKDQKLRG